MTNDGEALPKLFSIPWTKPPSVRRREIILPTEAKKGGIAVRPIGAEERARLLKAVAKAKCWVDELIAGTIADISAIAQREEKSERSVRMLLSLAFLDPAIIHVAARGQLPRGYGVTRLVDLPAAFVDQWAALGLTRPAT